MTNVVFGSRRIETSIKLLGTFIQSDLKIDKEISNLTLQLHNRIYNLKLVSQYTDFQTRLNFMNSFVVGKLNYMLLFYLNINEGLKINNIR